MSLDISLHCPHCDHALWEGNITHNLWQIADEAGIYQVLWHPEENGIKTAVDLIKPLSEGLDALRSNPDYYKVFNPYNGWGSYDGLVAAVANCLSFCREHPTAIVRASR